MKTARLNRESIARHYEWGLADLWENSPQRIDCWKVESSPLHFLDSLFSPDDLVWTGKVHESGNTRYGRHWQTCRDWVSGCHKSVGPMVSPAVWNPGTISRSAANVLKAPYVVLDFDGFDGVKPESPLEVENHLRASGGIIRWLREHLDWNLAAILWTGSKSLHAWFQTPPPEVLNSLKQVAVELGLDPGLIGRPEHPCRLPGQIHEKTGQESKVLWLQTQEVNISGDFQTPPY